MPTGAPVKESLTTYQTHIPYHIDSLGKINFLLTQLLNFGRMYTMWSDNLSHHTIIVYKMLLLLPTLSIEQQTTAS